MALTAKGAKKPQRKRKGKTHFSVYSAYSARTFFFHFAALCVHIFAFCAVRRFNRRERRGFAKKTQRKNRLFREFCAFCEKPFYLSLFAILSVDFLAFFAVRVFNYLFIFHIVFFLYGMIFLYLFTPKGFKN
jgi:hypothetical protein